MSEFPRALAPTSASYDARGLVQAVDYGSGAGALRVADYGTRAASGQPRLRKTGTAAQPNQFGGVRCDWAYDVLGRPVSDLISAGATQFCKRSYVFTPTGDYDRRHRIKTASGPAGYEYRIDVRHGGLRNSRLSTVNC